MRKLFLLVIVLVYGMICWAQPGGDRSVRLSVFSENGLPVPYATAELLKLDSSLVKTAVSDSSGIAEFKGITAGSYYVRIRLIGYQSQTTGLIDLIKNINDVETIVLKPRGTMLQDVTVTTKKPLVQFLPDKTVINVEAGITNAGATVMEVLEKSPGITVGRDGSIAMKGKPQVMVLIDGKQTQLNGAELQA
ncbi:MAG: TonB-dependent receptor, partial [Chitinophagaceae bacterium]|nr:TonB-dependent receptor [Chitinophagaceae bacterium]